MDRDTKSGPSFTLMPFKLFDSHCHVQFPQYDSDREEMLKRAKEAGVFMICVGTDLETSKKGIELAQKHDNIWASVGLHPNDNLHEKFDAMIYHSMLREPKVVAMGEVGLDYYRTTEPKDRDFQKKIFEEQLDLAIKPNVTLILHSRDSGKGSTGKVHTDMISMLVNCKLKIENSTQLRGVAHSFTGDIDDARKYLDLGFYLGFNGILTFARQYDEVVKYAPLDRILLETDSPFLAPEPHRGRRNEPVYVVEVAKKIAELKNEPLERVVRQTTDNCRKLFKLI